MELKRIAPKPKEDQPSLAPLIPIRVLKAPARPARARRPRRLALDTFFTRVLASSLLISLPAMVILASLMFAQELQSSTDLANGRAESSATVPPKGLPSGSASPPHTWRNWRGNPSSRSEVQDRMAPL